MRCPECDVRSHKSAYVQHMHTISAAALRLQRQSELEAGNQDCSLGQLLQGFEMQQSKGCDQDVGALHSPAWLQSAVLISTAQAGSCYYSTAHQ